MFVLCGAIFREHRSFYAAVTTVDVGVPPTATNSITDLLPCAASLQLGAIEQILLFFEIVK